MNRKRRDDAEDWFHSGDWNIDDIFNNLDGEFQKMRKQMDSLMRDALEGNMADNADKNPFVFGFSVKTGPDGFPVFEDFGNTRMRPFGKKGEKPTVDTRREPLTDINETDEQIAITVELPGVNKEDIDINVMEEKKFKIVKDFVNNAKFKGGSKVTIDGLRVDFDDGWGLIRASNTTPKLVLRFEAKTPSKLDE